MMNHFTASQFFCECGYSYAEHGPDETCLFVPGRTFTELKGCGATFLRDWGISRCTRGLLVSNYIYEMYHCGCLYGTLRHIAHFPGSAMRAYVKGGWMLYEKNKTAHGIITDSTRSEPQSAVDEHLPVSAYP